MSLRLTDPPSALSLKQPHQPHRPNSFLTLRSSPVRVWPPQVGSSIKCSKRQLFLGCLSQARVPAARFPELLSLPLAVGKLNFLRNENELASSSRGLGLFACWSCQCGAGGPGGLVTRVDYRGSKAAF